MMKRIISVIYAASISVLLFFAFGRIGSGYDDPANSKYADELLEDQKATRESGKGGGVAKPQTTK